MHALAHVQHTQHARKIARAKQAFEVSFFPFKPIIQYFVQKIIFLININTNHIYVLKTVLFCTRSFLKRYFKRKKSLYFYKTMIAKTIFSFFPCGVVIILSSITSYCFFKKKLIFWCSIE